MSKRVAALAGIATALVATIICMTLLFVQQLSNQRQSSAICEGGQEGRFQGKFHQQLDDAEQATRFTELLRTRRILNDNNAAIVRMHTAVASNLGKVNTALQEQFEVQVGHNYNYDCKQHVLYEVFRGEKSPSQTDKDGPAITADNATTPRVEQRLHRTIESNAKAVYRVCRQQQMEMSR